MTWLLVVLLRPMMKLLLIEQQLCAVSSRLLVLQVEKCTLPARQGSPLCPPKMRLFPLPNVIGRWLSRWTAVLLWTCVSCVLTLLGLTWLGYLFLRFSTIVPLALRLWLARVSELQSLVWMCVMWLRRLGLLT